ncbi:helix-turn-helix transcriptional regulator [Hoeflea olei]|uniref:HTH araC/xylS-type domain-containing protein n=1 Tax=Hoeflea olei TaxID=1480615 RepID=A0A1C1YVF2_9HYPH|nr:helix-turn-helix transcriptional regulator [Hoeflea olei]OCW57386.1 hypothetical protein AWJ14_18185 [Hoeflea olei]
MKVPGTAREFVVRNDDVTVGDLARFGQINASQVDIGARPLPTRPILRGDHRILRLQSGLSVHTSDTVAVENLTTTTEQAPGLSILLFLSGRVEVEIGEMRMTLGPDQDKPVHAVMIARARTERLVRTVAKGERVRHIVVTVRPEWIEACAFDTDEIRQTVLEFCNTHLSRLEWKADPALLAIAERMLHPPAMAEKLYLESRALDILVDGFAALANSEQNLGCPHLSPTGLHRLEMINATIAMAGNRKLSVEQVARESGVSVSTMQRLFRAGHAMSVGEYLRKRGLKLARRLLETENVSVAEAAYLAGYNSPTNFATAFKREFGVTPREARSGKTH